MAVTPNKVLLFLLGLTVAGGATAWVAGVFDARPPAVASDPAQPEPPKVATLPPSEVKPEQPAAPAAVPPADAPAEPPATQPPAAAGEQPAPAPAAEAPAAAPEPAQPPATAEVQPPTFDLVRAEADGSLVVAGKAAPNAKVEIVLGSRIIGSAVAGPEGDFAIVIDEPLKPGDYQLVLRSTSPGNVVAMSEETAVVSIPETADGQVLALVEKPGQPAKLITVPEAPKPAEPQPEAPAVAAADPAKPAEPPAAEAPAADGGQDVASAPAQPDPAAPAPPAAAEPPATEAPAAAQPEGAPSVAVEAVEIEGRKIFVAGKADAGSLLRGYANEILLGETKASEGGRFLIEAERDLPVGDYIIRIDVIGEDGVKVIARAAVPFQREPGENLAAVAPPAPAPEPAPAPAPPAAAEAPAAAPEPQPAPADVAAAPEQPAAPQAPAEAAAEPAPPATGEAPATAQAPEAPAPAPAEPAPADVAAAPAEPAPPAAEPAPPATAEPAPAPAAEPPAEVAAAPAPAEAPEVTAPKLQPVDGAVIIRRGDTLWRISKRVYGRGVRYSTIYLANQEQIRDPDRIWPGQVFSVPEKSKEGEAADMKQLGDQAVKVVPYDG